VKRLIIKILAFSFFVVGLVSCYPTRYVPADSYLYTGNSYKIKRGRIPENNIPAYFIQKTNSKLLVIRPRLWLYNVGKRFKDSSFVNKFLTKTLGEAPILYDSSLVEPTLKNIQQHLKNLGYYNAKVAAYVIKRPYYKIARVKYEIYPGKPYRIENINFDIPNRSIRTFVLADWGTRIIDSSMIFSVIKLQKERDRISKQLRNEGFYYFSKAQISFTADTNLNTYGVDLTLNIKEQSIKTNAQSDSIQKLEDMQYKFRRVYIFPEVSELKNAKRVDTSVYSYDYDHRGIVNYYFIHSKPLEVNPKTILQALFIKPDRYFKQNDITHTYQALNSLNMYSYINISIHDERKIIDHSGQLDCIIRLSKMTKYSLSSNSELKNTGGELGVEQSFGFVSRNTFKNGEVFRTNIRAALEVQSITNTGSTPNTILRLFNTFEAGINSSLEIPRFLAPVRRNFFSRYFNPKTMINFGYNYQDRPDYTRLILNGTFGYKWHSNASTSHIFNPVELSSVKIFPTKEFQSTIDNYQDPRIKYSYQDHLVLGMSYSYLYNKKRIRNTETSHFFFGKIELGGLPYNYFSHILGDKKDSLGQYRIGGVPYTQFARIDMDYRYYLPSLNGHLTNVFRLNIGVGIPMGGSVAIPFEKSFYIGGANSLRGWTIGTLGPGSYYSGSRTFEMTGDMRLEANYELRFPISEPLMGAVFADVGNIFLLHSSDVMPGGAFHFYNFYQKLAADIGYGLRYDMSFLVIRLDIAHPIYQPYRPFGDRWTMLSLGNNPHLLYTINFAIGYPF